MLLNGIKIDSNKFANIFKLEYKKKFNFGGYCLKVVTIVTQNSYN